MVSFRLSCARTARRRGRRRGAGQRGHAAGCGSGLHSTLHTAHAQEKVRGSSASSVLQAQAGAGAHTAACAHTHTKGHHHNTLSSDSAVIALAAPCTEACERTCTHMGHLYLLDTAAVRSMLCQSCMLGHGLLAQEPADTGLAHDTKHITVCYSGAACTVNLWTQR